MINFNYPCDVLVWQIRCSVNLICFTAILRELKGYWRLIMELLRPLFSRATTQQPLPRLR